ncbi:potassium voltage-gated channel subfamily KQT member 1 isoform X12 [Lutzomyia longipalpis]|uniref:potassium voltage-gated channel subfamily KQT member 1 isoform X12 n=1 Tax=Lutzomyia longipalpis TaxID=7200 RepID=UPI0024836CAA|nr:potassium voltage-gated channel subfamily KQT member 1 isoform X12 [Lutzomyia longipalpis]
MVGRVSRMSEPSRNLLTVGSLESGVVGAEGCVIGDIFENSCEEDSLSPTSLIHPPETPPIIHLPPRKKTARVEFVEVDSTDKPINLEDRDDAVRAKIFDEIRNACKLSDKHSADRLARPRMSLLGKPLNYNRGARRDARYRRLQSRVYNFLERPRGFPAVFYHVLVFLMVFTCLALSVFSTIQEYEDQAIDLLFRMEIIVVIWFTIEFFLRLWSSGCRSRYQGAIGRLRFLKRPFCIIDIITICASLVVLGMGTSGQVFATSALRGLRFFQILRMVRMDRRGGTWKLLGSVVYAHRQELITTLYIGFLGLIFASFLVYLMEKDVNKKFNNFAQALWWGVITLCTVGYGDMVPETWQGKLIASFCALLGISFFALPAGILGSGFALKVQQQQRQKHMIRRRQPAATLIQSLWRCYAADEHSVSVATWKIHQVPLPSPPPSRASSSFKHNASFVARLPTIRRHKSQSLHSPGNPKPPTGVTSRSTRGPRSMGEANASAENLDEDEEPRCIQLTNQHKTAIRFIRKLKYFVARRKFKQALKPYDVKDVMEQYAIGHVDLLGRVKNVQNRLDQILGKQGSKAKDVYASKISLASRVVKVERQVDDIETKLDTLIDLYMQDRKRFLSLPIISDSQHSNNLPPLPPNPPGGGGASAGATTVATTSMSSGSSGSLKVAGGKYQAAGDTGYHQGSDALSSAFQPKPILIDKQFSEPNSPITKTFEQPVQRRPPMHRGFSDLSNRMKKRVTLSSIPTQYVSNNNEQHDGSGDVVIVVNALDDGDPIESDVVVGGLPDVCIETEGDVEPSSPKTITESSIIMMDEEIEDLEEEDLDIEGELDPDSPPWDMYDVDTGDMDLDTEETALLRSKAANTEIIVTPISPVASSQNISRMEAEEHARAIGGSGEFSGGAQSSRMDLLKPEMAQSHRLLNTDDV